MAGGGEWSSEHKLRPHILAIPYPLMGHMTPIVQLCKIIIALTGCRVTIACNDKLVPGLCKLLPEKYITQGSSNNIRVVTISDGLPEEYADAHNWDVYRKLLRAFHEDLPRSFAKHMDSFRHDGVVCVLSDLYLSWAQDIADELGVPRLALWVSAPAEFQVYLHAEELVNAGKLPFRTPHGREKDMDNMLPGVLGRPPIYHRTDGILEGEEVIVVEGLPPLKRRDFPTFLQIEDSSDEFFFTFIENVKTATQASMVLFNTFEALEGHFLELLRSQGIMAHPIGPLFMLEDVVLKEQVQHEANRVQNGEEFQECLQWLDEKKPNSVIYVAFGTLIFLPLTQVKELARGLLNSRQGFIWVYPKTKEDDEGREEFLKSFLKQAHGKGLVLEWAPQKKILRHPAIGAFLSHCGWNSLLESICCGVPMVCLPFSADQSMNCMLVVNVWKVGLQLERKGEDGLALACDISHIVQELLVNEKGKQLQKRALQLKQGAHKSTQLGASSSRATLDAIIQLVKPS